MIKKFIYAMLAGVAISIGSVLYLLVENKVVGALLFSVGLMMVIEFKLNLVTGFIPTKREELKPGQYFIDTLLIFLGNVVGTIIVALLLRLTRISDKLVTASLAVSNVKLDDSLISLFILAIFCGFIIAMIVKAKNYKLQALFVAMMIAVFILCSFEHCVADSFYLAMSLKLFTWKGLLVLLIVFLGNFVGGYASSFIGFERKAKVQENIEQEKETIEETKNA